MHIFSPITVSLFSDYRVTFLRPVQTYAPGTTKGDIFP